MKTWNLAVSARTTHRSMHAVGTAIVIGLLAGFYNFVYLPLHRDMALQAERIENVRSLAVSGDQVAVTHRDLVRRLDELTKAAKAVRGRMPVDLAPSDFVEVTTQLAAALGVQVQQCQLGAPHRLEDATTIDVTCKLVGSYASICRYLVAVDQLPQIVRVARFELARSTSLEGYPVQITFQLYYQAQPNDKDRQRGTL